VVVRPAFTWNGERQLLANIELVDGEGRTLARLAGPMMQHKVWTEGPRYARALGVSVRFDVVPSNDDELDAREALREAPALLKAELMRIANGPSTKNGGRRLSITAADGALLGAAEAELGAGFNPPTLDHLLGEHFRIVDSTGTQLARLFSTFQLGERATIVVDPNGRVLGHVTAKGNPLFETYACAGPQGRRRACVRIGTAEKHPRITDGYGRRVGSLDLSRATSTNGPRDLLLQVQGRHLTGDARVLVIAMAVHASLASLARTL
jgi:hypothetical protein